MEDKMSTKEIVPGQPASPGEAWPAGGPTREEVQEVNQPKGSKPASSGLQRGEPETRWKRRALNTAAAGTAAFLGGTLAQQIHQAVNNPPLQSNSN